MNILKNLFKRDNKHGPVPKGYWQVAGGKQIAINDMETSHLMNTIAMLERNYPRVLESARVPEGWVSIEKVYPKIVELRAEFRSRIEYDDDPGDVPNDSFFDGEDMPF